MAVVKKAKGDAEPNNTLVVLLCVVTSITMIALAIPFIVTGAEWRDDTTPIPGGVLTEGRVVRVITDEGTRRDRRTYRAVVEYTDTAGTRHRLTNKAGETPPYVDEVVQISYPADDPASGRNLTTGRKAWKVPYVTGIAIIVVSVVIDLIVIGTILIKRRRAG